MIEKRTRERERQKRAQKEHNYLHHTLRVQDPMRQVGTTITKVIAAAIRPWTGGAENALYTPRALRRGAAHQHVSFFFLILASRFVIISFPLSLQILAYRQVHPLASTRDSIDRLVRSGLWKSTEAQRYAREALTSAGLLESGRAKERRSWSTLLAMRWQLEGMGRKLAEVPDDAPVNEKVRQQKRGRKS